MRDAACSFAPQTLEMREIVIREILVETRAQLLKKFGMKDIPKPPSPVRFQTEGEPSRMERVARERIAQNTDQQVARRGGYERLYPNLTSRSKPSLEWSNSR